MTAAALALLGSLLYGFVDFGVGRAARAWPNLSIVGVMQLTEVTLALILAAFFGQPLTSPGRWVWIAVLGGLAAALAMLAFVQALALGPMGLVAPISGCSGAVPVLAGVVAGIPISALAGGGCILCIAGITMLAWEPDRLAVRASHGATVLLSLVALLAIGGASVAVAGATARAGTLDAVAVMRVTTAGAMGAVILYRPPQARVPRRLRLRFVGFAVMELGALICVSLAYGRGSLPVVGLLSALYPVVTVLLARALLNEVLGPRQVAAAAVALIGTGLVAAGGG